MNKDKLANSNLAVFTKVINWDSDIVGLMYG